MKKLPILLLILLIVCSSASAQKLRYVLIGRIIDADSLQQIMLTSFGDGTTQTVPVIQGQFMVTGNIPYPSLALVAADNVRSGLGVWLASDTIRASFSVRKYREGYQLLQPVAVAGPQESVDYFQNIETLNGYSNLNLSRQEINQLRADFTNQYVRTHRNSAYALFLLKSRVETLGTGLTKELFAGMSDELQRSETGTQLINQLRNLETNELGKTVDDFTLPNAEGARTSLYKATKTYTLLNFWSSSCQPCRVHNRDLVKLHQQVGPDKLRILSISVDEERKNWLGAVKKDGLVWEQLSDLKGWSSPVAKQFSIFSIPQTILLDADNKIVAITTQDAERILSGK